MKKDTNEIRINYTDAGRRGLSPPMDGMGEEPSGGRESAVSRRLQISKVRALSILDRVLTGLQVTVIDGH